jgi:DNA processing protein
VASTAPEADGDLNVGEAIQRFALAAWSGLAEPGDRVAGSMVQTFGAAVALDMILDDEVNAGDIDLRLDDANAFSHVDHDEIRNALDRYASHTLHIAGQTAVSLGTAARLGVKLYARNSTDWPEGMNDLGFHAPHALWLRGKEEAMASLSNSIAIVGARAATDYGGHVTMETSASMSDRGVTVVSGGAYGIDGMAHRAALAGQNFTVAFLAGGVDRFYPSGHGELLGRVATYGAVVSELPPGATPTKHRFLQRNRLIAAASQATLVIEAGFRSGSLNTAVHATTLGRPLGAVPGPVTSAASAGCHRLIRENGAECITNPDQAFDMLPAVELALA